MYDPLIENKSNHLSRDYKFVNNIKNKFYDVIIYSVDHKVFSKLSIKKIKNSLKQKNIFFDLKFKYREKDVDSYI